MRRCLILLLLLSSMASAQTIAYVYDRALGTNPFAGGSVSAFVPISYGPVRVCSAPASGSPCTPVATIYDIFGNPLTVSGGNFGQLTTDVVGNYNFGCTIGTYEVQVAAASNNTPQLQYLFSCPAPPSTGTGNVLAPGGGATVGDFVIFGNTAGTQLSDGGSHVTNAQLPVNITLSGNMSAGTFNISNVGTLTATTVNTTNLTGVSSLSLTTLSATTITGSPTFSGAPNITSGGVLGGTFTGSPTLSGNIAFTGTPTFANTLAVNTTGTSGGLTGTPSITVGSVIAGATSVTSFTDTNLVQGQQPSVNATGVVTSSNLYKDAAQFSASCTHGTNDDVCIQAAMAAIPTNGIGVIDISGMGNITTATNPFATLQQQVQPASPLKCGEIWARSGQVITTNGPWLVPMCWHFKVSEERWAQNSGGPIVIPGASFPPCWGLALPCNTTVESATVTTSASNCANNTCVISVTPTSGTPFTSSMLWSHFGVCTSNAPTNTIFGSWGGACVGAVSPNNGCGATGQGSGSFACLAFGAIIGVNINSALPNGCGSANCLLVSVPATGSGLYGGGSGPANALGVNYVIWAPVVTLGDFNESNINMGVQWEGGSIQTGPTQNIATGGASPVACANYNSQEESYFRFVQCLPQGTGKGVGLDVEGGSFNSGPYDNVIITFPGNCNTAASQGTGNPLAVIFRQNASASYPRSFMNTTLTSSGCQGTAGISPMIDWESSSTFGPGIHIESGSGNNNVVDVNDGANIICPVFCPMLPINAQNTEIVDVNTTVLGASGNLVRIASGANMKSYTIRRLYANGGNLLADLATGCTVSRTAEPSLALYATTNINNTPTIMASTSQTQGCQPQTSLPAVMLNTAYTNSTSGFTGVGDGTRTLRKPVGASSTLNMTCYITWSVATSANAVPKYQITGPASPTAVLMTLTSTLASGTAVSPVTAFSTAISNGGTPALSTNYTDTLNIGVLNGVTTSTVTLQAAPQSTVGSGVLTIQPGSYCQ